MYVPIRSRRVNSNRAGYAYTRTVDVFADRLSADDIGRDSGADRRFVEQGHTQTKNTLRHLALGVYISDSRSGYADAFCRLAEVAIS